jgi:hypothetical protein
MSFRNTTIIRSIRFRIYIVKTADLLQNWSYVVKVILKRSRITNHYNYCFTTIKSKNMIRCRIYKCIRMSRILIFNRSRCNRYSRFKMAWIHCNKLAPGKGQQDRFSKTVGSWSSRHVPGALGIPCFPGALTELQMAQQTSKQTTQYFL